MTQITPDQKSRFESLTQEYSNFLSDGGSPQEISEDEQSILDEIAKQIDEIRTVMKAAEGASEGTDSQGVADGEAANRKTGRLNKIKDMRSSIAGLMASLKSAR